MKPSLETFDEWKRISGGSVDRTHVRFFHYEEDVDFQAIAQSTRFREMEDLWVEHWFEDEGHDDDFRPWFDVLANNPPSALRAFEVGGFGDRSTGAKLGPVAPTVAALSSSLESLGLSGNMNSVEPFAAPHLTTLDIRSGEWMPDRLEAFVRGIEVPRLRTLIVFLEGHGSPDPIGSLARIADLEHIELGHFRVTPGFFEELERNWSSSSKLEMLQLGNCRWPIETEEEEALVAAIISCGSILGDTQVVLPTDAQDARDHLAAAGLHCEFEPW